MSPSLENVDNLGALEDIIFLLKRVSSIDGGISVTDLRKYCSSISQSYAHSFDGIIYLLTFIKTLVDKGGRVSISKLGSRFVRIGTATEFRMRLIESLFESLRRNNELSNFISLEMIKFDIPSKSISLASSSIPLKYFQLRNFLIRIGFFVPSNLSSNILLVDSAFSELFERLIESLRKEVISFTQSRPLSYQQLQEILTLKESYGYEAEEYVLDYEKITLARHKKVQDIKIISKIDVAAGYDIISFVSEDSIFIDKFIEVKSYSNNPSFYWSQNEIEASRRLEEHYYVYLVDRLRFRDSTYSPIMIRDPYNTIFNSKKWDKKATNWLVSLSN